MSEKIFPKYYMTLTFFCQCIFENKSQLFFVTCSHHLKLTILKWGLPARLPFKAKLKQAIPACPAVLFFIFIRLRIFFLCRQAHSLQILFPSSRILTAAFTSRSIRFPHSHRYVRSDNASSFFLCPHTLHILLDAKYLSTFIRYFPHLQWFSCQDKNLSFL